MIVICDIIVGGLGSNYSNTKNKINSIKELFKNSDIKDTFNKINPHIKDVFINDKGIMLIYGDDTKKFITHEEVKSLLNTLDSF